MPYPFDVVIVGGGAVGSAVARELSRYKLSVAVLEKDSDVCLETSGRNTAVVHGGFAYPTGSWKARLCVEGNRMMGNLSKELDFSFNRTGKVLVGNTPEERSSLLRTKAQGEKNGVEGLRMVEEEELHTLVPSVIGSFALYSPNSGILDPFGYTIALAENAAENGVRYYLSHEVISIVRSGDSWLLSAGGETFLARWVVNAAGLGCKKINDMLGLPDYKIIGSKDDYIVLDNRLGQLVPMPIYTVPSNTYMGIHVTITTDGNVLLGPTAEETNDLSYYGTARKNITYLEECARKIWPHFSKGDYIRTFSGILPKWVDASGVIQDFKMEILDDVAPRVVNLFGIESPGLTCAVPIARHVVEMMRERERLVERKEFNPERKGIVRFKDLPLERQKELVEKDPSYGEVVCRCQKVTKAEVRDAINNPLGAKTMVSVKYRTRCMMGRCQGGYCQMRIARMLEELQGIKDTDLQYANNGSPLFVGKVREEGNHGKA